LDSALTIEIASTLALLGQQCQSASGQLSSLALTLTDQLDGALVETAVQELFGYVQRLLAAAQQYFALQWRWTLEGH